MWESHHPPTQVVKVSSPLGPPWGIPRFLLGQRRHSDLQKQHPKQFNLDGAARWAGGVSIMCDTLQYTNGLHSFQPTELLFLSSSRMGRFGSPWGGQTFCLCGSHSVVFITCLAPVFLDIHPLPNWKHEPCSQGQIFIYKGFDCSQVNLLWKLFRPFGLQVTLLTLYFSWQKFMQEIKFLLHIFLLY